MFSTSLDGTVETKPIGVTPFRTVLCRSQGMEALILRETDKLVEDWTARTGRFDGLIYLMYVVRPRTKSFRSTSARPKHSEKVKGICRSTSRICIAAKVCSLGGATTTLTTSGTSARSYCLIIHHLRQRGSVGSGRRRFSKSFPQILPS